MGNLRVLHISQTDHLGGSGRSAYKIHAGVRALGAESRMLVSLQDTSDPDVDRISRGLGKAADDVCRKVTNVLGLQYVFIPSSFTLLRHPWYRSADIIQLYNTHGGYFSHSVLPLLARGKKVVWRLSDLWPITGHCTFPEDCAGWRTGCRPCPYLAYYPAIPWDSASYLYAWKKALYSRTEFHVVAPSSWAKRAAEESPLFHGKQVSFIPNGVDVDLYKPMDKSACRTRLGIPPNKKVILFTAQRLPNNPRKGGDFFIEAMNQVAAERDDLLALLVGEGADQWGRTLRCDVSRHETVREPERMAAMYNAADVLVHPAVGDNLPNSVLESMSCGVPTVAFDAGGVKDAVGHKTTGYLARSGNKAELADGLRWVLSEEAGDAISRRCRETIVERFALQKQSAAFITLYQSLLGGKS